MGCHARHCPAALLILPWLRPEAWKGVVSDAVVAAGQRFRFLRKEGEDHLEWVSECLLVGAGKDSTLRLCKSNEMRFLKQKMGLYHETVENQNSLLFIMWLRHLSGWFPQSLALSSRESSGWCL